MDSCEWRDWSGLLPDVLGVITRKIRHRADYTSFRAVCTSWREAAPRSRLPPLLIFSNLNGGNRIVFLDPVSRNVRDISMPEFRGTAFLGASQGMMSFIGFNGEIFLINPVSKARVQLPPATRDLAVASLREDIEDDDLVYIGAPRGFPFKFHPLTLRTVFIREIILSSPPGGGEDCVALGVLPHSNKVALCRPGDSQWTLVPTGLTRSVTNATFCQGKAYVANKEGMSVFNVQGQLLASMEFHVWPLPQTLDDFRLVAFQGKLLYVYTAMNLDEYDRQKQGLDKFTFVFEYEPDLENWHQLHTLGESTVFLSQDYSPCIIGNGFVGCNSNRIYSSSRDSEMVGLFEQEIHHYRIVHMDDDAVEDICCFRVLHPNQSIQWITLHFD